MRDPFCVEIAIIDDVIFESVEYFSVSLRGMTPGMTMDETSLSAKVFITDAGPIAPGGSPFLSLLNFLYIFIEY